MSGDDGFAAVVTPDQIYTKLVSLETTLVELKVRFELVANLETRLGRVEKRQEEDDRQRAAAAAEDRRNRKQLLVAWIAAAAGAAGSLAPHLKF